MGSGIKSAITAAIVSIVISIVSGVATFQYTDSVSQARSARIQTVLTFTDRGFPLADLSAKYIAAVTSGKSVDDLQVMMRAAIAQEMLASEDLREILKKDASAIDNYEAALKEFSATLSTATTPVQMRPWVEAFGKTVDARRALNKTLRSSVDV